MRWEKPGQDSLVNVEKLRYSFLLPANVQMLKIGEADSDLYSSDEEIKYIFLDEYIKTGVLAACIDQSKTT